MRSPDNASSPLAAWAGRIFLHGPGAPWRLALLAALLVLPAEQAVEHFARRADIQRERLAIQGVLTALRARLEGEINANLLSVHGLCAVISARPEMDQAEFAHIARGLAGPGRGLRNIAGAPGMVISLMYPMAGNETALGLDYRTHPRQRADALRARETRRAVLSGPLPLQQGGIGVVVREPVFVPPSGDLGEPRFWGLVSAVMDPDTLFRKAGLDEAAGKVRLALRGRLPEGGWGPAFHGDGRVFAEEPETMSISLPGNAWQLAAVPRDGWGRASDTLWLIRLMGLVAALAASGLAWRLARDITARKQAEDRIRTLNRVYAMLGGINEAIVRLRQPQALFQESCRIAAEEGGFRMAWLGMVEADGRRIRPLAHAGHEAGYLDNMKIVLDDSDLGHGPTAMALKAGRHMVCNDITQDPRMGPWREAALARGYRSSAAFPIQVAGQVRGAFNLYAAMPGFFDAMELGLLDRLAADIGFALEFIEADRALREKETFFRLIAENMADLVAVLDLEGRRLYNSPSYRTLFGDPEALRGTDSFAEIHPDDRDRVRQVFQDTVRMGTGQRMEFRFVLPDGQVRHMESQGGVIRDAQGRVAQVVVVSRDITDRKRLEAEVRQLNADLEERVKARTAELASANKELETFTYTVSHDLKAPLRGIDGYSRLLQEDHLHQLDEEGRLFLANVRQGVEQMSQLIDDLLAYSRMERRNLHGMPLDLGRQVEAILAERRADLEARGVEVSVDLDGLTARADPDGLAMVLRNLVDNAVKFSRDSHPPRIAISAETTEQSVILRIRDNGIGFDMQFHDRIFDIFQRLQRAEDYPGTGVGLAIVRKAMQRMGGRVWAQSAPGQGATFCLELPR